MKIAIITLGGYYNYGNRLQNFALFHELSSRKEITVETIKTPGLPIIRPISNFHNLMRFLLKDTYRYFPMKARNNVFKKFTENYTVEYLPSGGNKLAPSDVDKFDKFIVGSDQIWNFDFLVDHEVGFYLLEGVPSEKRISYAASMGNPPIMERYSKEFSENIKKFSHVSVREAATQKYLKEEFAVDSSLVLDPVFLLSKSEWINSLSLHPRQDKIVFTYFLSRPSSEFSAFIHRYAKSMGCRIVAFQNLTGRNRKYFKEGPKQFVEHIAGAQAVFTDSFHASAFSTIFGVPYVVDNNRRGGTMSSRIETLIEISEVSGTVFSDRTSVETVNQIDFSNAIRNIERLRKISKEFIEEAIAEH